MLPTFQKQKKPAQLADRFLIIHKQKFISQAFL